MKRKKSKGFTPREFAQALLELLVFGCAVMVIFVTSYAGSVQSKNKLARDVVAYAEREVKNVR